MSLTRRNLGLGLIAAGAAVTGGVLVDRSHPGILRRLGLRSPVPLDGFAGGETLGLLADPQIRDLVRRAHGRAVNARLAGGVEQCRRPELLSQQPAFLLPAISSLAPVARSAGAPVRHSADLFASPLVLHSWEPVAAALVRTGLAQVEQGITYVDTRGLLEAVVQGRSWADLGLIGLPDAVRIISTDPRLSAGGLLFMGLAASTLAGGSVSVEALASHRRPLSQILGLDHFQTFSSQRLFNDYLPGGMGAAPMVVGYESQLIEWIAQNAGRWGRVQRSAPHRPVTLHLRPTVASTHALISLSQDADALQEVLRSHEALAIAWRDHGLRSSIGVATAGALPARAAAASIIPLPDAAALLGLLDDLDGSAVAPGADRSLLVRPPG